MARMPRVVAVGHPHHVTQRGNLGGRVFETDGDRRFYLDLLADGMARFGLRVWAHCLMTNHIHLVCVPEAEHALSKVLARVHGRLAQRINRRRKQRGHLWQGRFYACPMDESHCWAAIRYVERNPVRAGLVAKAEDLRWSRKSDRELGVFHRITEEYEMTNRRRFTAEFKARWRWKRCGATRRIQQIAAKHKVHPNQVSAWKRQAVDGLGEVFSNEPRLPGS